MAHSDHSAGRRRILLSGAALAGLAAFRAGAQGSFDWQKYKGTAIEVGMQRTNFADSIKRRIPEFEALTGMSASAFPAQLRVPYQMVVPSYASFPSAVA